MHNDTNNTKNTSDTSIAVIGGGAWGGALASTLAQRGHRVSILVRDDGLARALMQGRLPRLNNVAITPPTQASTNAEAVLADAAIILMVVPVAASTYALNAIKQHAMESAIVGMAAKGLYSENSKNSKANDTDTPQPEALLQPELAGLHITQPPVMLCGPSFAIEVVAGKPCCLVAAASDTKAATSMANIFAGTPIRVYVSDDPIGVAVASSVKNVIAIAAGMLDALALGSNARAALITRGLAEATRLALALGGRRETLFGLAGAGDLLLTATDKKSRNYAYGLALAQGKPPAELLAEGVHTASRLVERANQAGVELPIIAAVDRVVNQGSSIADEIKALLARPADYEWK